MSILFPASVQSRILFESTVKAGVLSQESLSYALNFQVLSREVRITDCTEVRERRSMAARQDMKSFLLRERWPQEDWPFSFGFLLVGLSGLEIYFGK